MAHCVTVFAVVPLVVITLSVVPVAIQVAHAPDVRAATKSVLILATSVSGGTSSAEAEDVPSGVSVTVASASVWDAMTTAQFEAYNAIIIGDPSSSDSCSAAVPSDALSTAATWGAAVTDTDGNVAVLGTAPSLAGSSGTTLIKDAIAYVLSGSGTGLYVSLNCEYSSASAGTSVPLLADVDGGGFTVTGQSSSCQNAGTVNTWESEDLTAFNGLAGSDLGTWSAPACSVEETLTGYPSGLDVVAYDAGVSPAVFTASDGATGQAYVVVGAASSGSAALSTSTGGEVEVGATAGGSNAADPGLSESETAAGDPVNPETGEFTEDDTDLSVPSYGPELAFSRSYDSAQAQAQEQTGTPGPVGYGWTDTYGASLSAGKPAAGDIYTVDGLRTENGDGEPATTQPLSAGGTVVIPSDGNLYIADPGANRIEEVAGSSGTQWGMSMTTGDMYTIVGSSAGTPGRSVSGTAMGSALLDDPQGFGIDNSGNLYIADTGNNRVLEIPATSGTQHGITMTADDIYVIAGSASGTAGSSGIGGAATSALLDAPVMVSKGYGTSEDVYIVDSGNNRVLEIPAETGTQFGISMTADDIYDIAGSASGSGGDSGDGGKATSALLESPGGVAMDPSGDVYIADSGNNQVRELAAVAGTQWGQSMTDGDIYTVVGSSSGTAGHSGDGSAATSALLDDPQGVSCGNGDQLYVADTGNNRIQEVAHSTHTEFGTSMTVDDIYTIAGSSSGTAGFFGDGSAATSALLSRPGWVTIDHSYNLYLADTGNARIREVGVSSDDISTIAGDGGSIASVGDGGLAPDGGLSTTAGTAMDSRGDVFIADAGNNRVQEIAASTHTQFGMSMTAGDVYTVVGSSLGTAGYTGDGGAATSALLDDPEGVAVDEAGNLYVADTGNNRVQKVAVATGTITTVVGSATGASGTTGDGGAAGSGLLDSPEGLAAGSTGDLYIADSGNNRVQEVPASTGTHWGISMTTGDVYTVAGSAAGTAGSSGNGGTATSATLQGLTSVAVDQAGSLYLTDITDMVVREVAAASGVERGITMTSGDIYRIAGTGTASASGDGGKATLADLSAPAGVAVDSSADVFIADTGNGRIQEVPARDGAQRGEAMTAGDMYTVAGSSAGTRGDTGDGGTAAAARLEAPDAVTVDTSGDLFISDETDNLLREVTASASSPFAVSPAAGVVTVTQGDGAQVNFYPQNSSGACTSPYVVRGEYCALPQYTATLTYSSVEQTYSFIPDPGTTLVFSALGQLQSETDAAGNTLTVTYDSPAPGSGACLSTATWCDVVTAANGRALTEGFSSAGLVTSVTDPLDRTWTYGYNSSDQLTSATDPLGNETTYTYGSGSSGSTSLASDLLTVTKPAGGVTTNTYDSQGRVVTQTDPMGYETTFDYSDLDTATGDGVTWVGDPDGYHTAYDYASGALAAESKWSGTTLVSEEDYGPDTASGTLLDAWTANGKQQKTSYSYDSSGNVLSTTDPRGDTTTSEYTSLDDDSCDGTAEATTACSSSETGPSVVSPGGTITPPSSAPPSGVTYTLYDTDGNELYSDTGVYEPGSSTASYQQVSYTLYKGNTVALSGGTVSCTYAPPSQSLPCAKINADGVVTQLEYNSYGDLILSATPDGNGSETATTTYAYDGDGEQTAETSPDGNLSGATSGNYTTVTAYNADGQKTAVSQGDGSGATVTARATTYGYDADGNQTTVTGARGYTTTTTYNADDQATVVGNPYSNHTLTCYDGDGNTVQTVPAVGYAADSLSASSCPTSYPADYGDRLASDATTYTYDADGDKTAETTPAPAGHSGYETTTYTYDAAGNLTKTDAPPSSNFSSVPDDITVDTYDTDAELSAETTGYGTSTASTIVYCYDADGDKTAVIPGDGNASATTACGSTSPYETTYSYDSAGEMVSQTTPATSADSSGGITTYTYDPAGNQLTVTDPKDITTTYTYNAAGKKATATYSGSSAHSVAYTYDADGNRTAMTDATGTSSYSYDAFDELTAATNGNGQKISYGYDADGDITAITYPLPPAATWATTDTVKYGYDHADRLSSVTDFTGSKTTITDNGDDLPKSETLPSGDTISYSYDSTDAIASITLASSAGTTLQSFSYGDAPDGSILTETDSPTTAGTSKTYSYTAQDQVASEATSSTSDSYGFDQSGNLTGLPGNATGTYDDAGELTSSATSSGAVTDYAYNADGERTAATTSGTTTASATWNGAGELTSYDDSSDDMTAASYDGDGLRASATTSSGSTQDYVWNTLADVPQMIMDSTNAYIYTSGIAPAEQVSLSTGTITDLITDSLGSVRGTVNSSGALTGSVTYDAWGNPLTTGGLTATTPYGYAGSYTDTTGLDYLVNRYYDSATGQFISTDPQLVLTSQPYEYANGEPVSTSDPDGLFPVHVRAGWIWADLYFNQHVTATLASLYSKEEGVIFIADDIIADEELGPIGAYFADLLNEKIVQGQEEARRIAGDTRAERSRYLRRANKSCIELSVGVYFYWGIPRPYGFWTSYKYPKAWCLG